MVLVTKFCFSCSVRLGSIITGMVTLLQASVLLGITLKEVESLYTVSETLNRWRDSLKLEGRFFEEVAQNPKTLIVLLSIFFSCLICSCVLLLYGSFQCKPIWMYPFVFLYLLYIIGLFLALLLLILFVKNKGNGLGDLILYSNLGGFILLFYLYTWSCVVSFIQIVKELKARLVKKLKIVENMKFANNIKIYRKNNIKNIKNKKGFYDYASK